MNRKIVILLSLLLVSVLLALPVFATTGSGTAAASAETVKAGDTVEVVFSLEGFEQVNTLSMSFAVPEGLKLEKAQWLIAGTISDVNTNKGQAVWTKDAVVAMTGKTDVFKLTLTVLEPAAGVTEKTFKVDFKSNVKLDAALLDTVTASASFKLSDECSHTLKEVAAKAPTCNQTGNNLYYICEGCGKVFGADKVTETTVEKQTLTATATHSGGTATCKDKAVCTVCGSAYGELIGHTFEETWTTDSKEHWHSCTVCGEKLDAAAHSLKWVVDQHPTESAAGKKHQTCETCNYQTEATVIAKLYHNPVLVKGQAPTCTEAGTVDHFYCSSCGRYYACTDGKVGEKIAKEDITAEATGHTYADAWTTDSKEHWHACSCGEIADQATHEFELVDAVEATAEQAGYTGDEVCKVCDYLGKKGETVPCLETEPTAEPTTEPTTVPSETQAPAQQEEPEETKCNGILWIILVVIAVAVAVIVPVVIKRKRG